MANYTACLRQMPCSKTDQYWIQGIKCSKGVLKQQLYTWSHPGLTSCIHASTVILFKLRISHDLKRTL
jgi:hypothetical protein